jgi:hypothetical protein
MQVRNVKIVVHATSRVLLNPLLRAPAKTYMYVQWLCPHRIQKVPGSNFIPKTACSKFYSQFPHVFSGDFSIGIRHTSRKEATGQNVVVQWLALWIYTASLIMVHMPLFYDTQFFIHTILKIRNYFLISLLFI